MQGSWAGGLAIRHKSSRDNAPTRQELSARHIRKGKNFGHRRYSLTSRDPICRSGILPLAMQMHASAASCLLCVGESNGAKGVGGVVLPAAAAMRQDAASTWYNCPHERRSVQS